jgi:DNA modification methylase
MILTGDALTMLRTMDAGSVHCCVTSPPYWGLRDYRTATWEGGDEGCDHVKQRLTCGKNTTSTLKNDGRRKETTGHSDSEYEAYTQQYRDTCGKCGARRIDSQLGLERTPEEYVANMVEVFREVRRVLRDDGTVWLNLGDSYATPKVGNTQGTGSSGISRPSHKELNKAQFSKKCPPGLKPKDLCGIPWRVAFALQADGWYLRQDIIWHKPNPMPESVTDRCTKAHEYIFLLSKSATYYYDHEAVMEKGQGRASKCKVDGKGVGEKGFEIRGGFGATRDHEWVTRNKRSVWTVTTRPYKGAHFATFPPKVVEPCILAGCPVGGTVLDPFLGSGTTASMAISLGRRYIGIELNPDYVKLAERRIIETQPPLFVDKPGG